MLHFEGEIKQISVNTRNAEFIYLARYTKVLQNIYGYEFAIEFANVKGQDFDTLSLIAAF